MGDMVVMEVDKAECFVVFHEGMRICRDGLDSICFPTFFLKRW